MTARERWSHWHWTTRAMIVAGLITVGWGLLTALFVPRREYEKAESVHELRYQRDSIENATFRQKVTRYIDYQNCKEFCALKTPQRYGDCSCLRPDRP